LGKKSIILALGDITTYHADAIVNAANGDLTHAGGIAKAIADAGNSVVELFTVMTNSCFRVCCKHDRVI